MRAGYDAVLAERRQRALQLRQAGLSYRAIGRELDVDHETVRNDLRVCMRDLMEERLELAQFCKAQEDARLDEMLQALHRFLRLRDVGNVVAVVNAMVRISERRAKLWGLDAPAKIETHACDDLRSLSDEELETQALEAAREVLSRHDAKHGQSRADLLDVASSDAKRPTGLC